MKRVILESPYAGDTELNVRYARACVRDSLSRGEAPIASHLLYTQPGVLRDEVPEERQWGIDAGLAWREVAEASVVYTDLGISEGMEHGMDAAKAAGVPVYKRLLPGLRLDYDGTPLIPGTETCMNCDRPAQFDGYCARCYQPKPGRCFVCGEPGSSICGDCAASARPR